MLLRNGLKGTRVYEQTRSGALNSLSTVSKNCSSRDQEAADTGEMSSSLIGIEAPEGVVVRFMEDERYTGTARELILGYIVSIAVNRAPES